MKRTLDDLMAARAEVPPHCVLYDPNRVAPRQCATCPWRGPEDGGLVVPAETMAELKEDPNAGNQYCHAPAFAEQPQPEEFICRGHREHWKKFFYDMGLLPDLTDEAWAEALTQLQS